MQNNLPWAIALVSSFGLLSLALAWALRRPNSSRKQLPITWSLTARPVFSADERRVYRLLKVALPQHAILSKLPLVRFCQPTETSEVRYWFDLLGAVHVSFAICSPNGRVLAAIDLESERSVTGRSAQIKQSVLDACRVRYLRCPADKLPSIAELQLLVPFSNSQSRSPQATPAAVFSRAPQAPLRPNINGQTPRRVGKAPAEPSPLWQDSSVFRDSFFSQDRQFSASGNFHDSEMFDALLNENLDEPLNHADRDDLADAPDDIVGVVVDTPRYGNANRLRSMSGLRSR